MSIADSAPFTSNQTPEQSPDSFVGTLDKAAFHTMVTSEGEAALANGTPLSVLFMDLNGFKGVNDTLGHDVGDIIIEGVNRVVSTVATTESGIVDVKASERQNANDPVIARGTVRRVTAGHIGGDEFAILSNVDEEGAEELIVRLREAFDAYMAEETPLTAKLQKLNFGLAVGAGTLKDSVSDMMREADVKMYTDKIEQLPGLTRKQRRALLVSNFLLSRNGISVRDIPKHMAKIAGTTVPTQETTQRPDRRQGAHRRSEGRRRETIDPRTSKSRRKLF